ncbi:jg23570 [Pararge aegeria aegeria]|uniref:Jg23570 protein n=1 Tax=Pararge aegeria aegeria TaxID=348720 RepID=A0A8S4RY04_9NEOP|nr:jg23570 [Pararge aegeria aegeria]
MDRRCDPKVLEWRPRNGKLPFSTTSLAQRSASREAEVATGGAQSPKTDGRWGLKVLEWRTRTGKRSVGRPPTRWTDDISPGAGNRWRQTAQDLGLWQQWSGKPSPKNRKTLSRACKDHVLHSANLRQSS